MFLSFPWKPCKNDLKTADPDWTVPLVPWCGENPGFGESRCLRGSGFHLLCQVEQRVLFRFLRTASTMPAKPDAMPSNQTCLVQESS
jgi:hypothetical protein